MTERMLNKYQVQEQVGLHFNKEYRAPGKDFIERHYNIPLHE